MSKFSSVINKYPHVAAIVLDNIQAFEFMDLWNSSKPQFITTEEARKGEPCIHAWIINTSSQRLLVLKIMIQPLPVGVVNKRDLSDTTTYNDLLGGVEKILENRGIGECTTTLTVHCHANSWKISPDEKVEGLVNINSQMDIGPTFGEESNYSSPLSHLSQNMKASHATFHNGSSPCYCEIFREYNKLVG